jgi:hypothetical protein
MAMPLIDGGISADAVEDFVAVDVPEPNALGALDDEVERMIVVGAVALFGGDQIARAL